MILIDIIQDIIAQARETEKQRLWAATKEWRSQHALAYRNAQRIPMLRRLFEAIEAETNPSAGAA